MSQQQPEKCDRCVTNDTDCVFAQPKRSRARAHPYSRPTRHTSTPQQEPEGQESSNHAQQSPSPSPSTPQDTISAFPLPTHQHHEPLRPASAPQPLITPEIRARIIATLATLKGKRGAPFSFITSGDTPTFSTGAGQDSAQNGPQQPPTESSGPTQPSLKLSWLLRPLRINARAQNGHHGHHGHDQPASYVEMPSYLSSMTLGQTITDPIESGILSSCTSLALFEHFMLEMNAKWEYVLDPHCDTHDDIRRRSKLLFATILFCSSKFVNFTNGHFSSVTDPFLQSRLCSLARNLAIRTFAGGDRSIETMQAFYLLVCWKDPDDDVSYLHSGYALRILHDLDLEQVDVDKRQTARRMRTWLALFRQDKQQSLFFMRRGSLSLGDDDPSFVGDLETWLKMPQALPWDLVACCSADLRQRQYKLRVMIEKSSSTMLPCLLELMDSELSRWRAMWQSHLEGEGRLHASDDPLLNQKLLNPGKHHLNNLMGLWEQSVRLNVASAILRQALMASLTSSLRSTGQPPPSSLNLDLPAIEEVLSTDVPGLSSSVEGAFGTLRYMLAFPNKDLRRSPDAVLLLGPNAALFLCLLLCLPCNSILGPAFQRTAVGLIQDIARHVGECVQSPQDTIKLHAAYLDSLVSLVSPATPRWPSNSQEMMPPTTFDLSNLQVGTDESPLDETTLQAAHVLAGGMGGPNFHMDDSEVMFGLDNDPKQNLHMQSLANLLDPSFFWDIPPNIADNGSQF